MCREMVLATVGVARSQTAVAVEMATVMEVVRENIKRGQAAAQDLIRGSKCCCRHQRSDPSVTSVGAWCGTFHFPCIGRAVHSHTAKISLSLSH